MSRLATVVNFFRGSELSTHSRTIPAVRIGAIPETADSIPLLLKEVNMRVQVCAYERFRFGRWEHVCAHTRRYPMQLAFGF